MCQCRQGSKLRETKQERERTGISKGLDWQCSHECEHIQGAEISLVLLVIMSDVTIFCNLLETRLVSGDLPRIEKPVKRHSLTPSGTELDEGRIET